jgi:hypothetical protein
VGNPQRFEDELLDTELKERFLINKMVVPATDRGEENIDLDWTTKSLRGWVFVTSSADPHVRAGMYRLIDLQLFRAESCSALPNAQCSANTDYVQRSPAFNGNPFNIVPNIPFMVPRDGGVDNPARTEENSFFVPPEVLDGIIDAVNDGSVRLEDVPEGLRRVVEDAMSDDLEGQDRQDAFVQRERRLGLMTKFNPFQTYLQRRSRSPFGRYKRKGSLRKNRQGRQSIVYTKVYLNQEKQYADGLNGASHWRTGKEALLAHRCNRLVATHLGADPCNHAPYSALTSLGCTGENLMLESDPTGSEYGAAHWLFRLEITPSPSPPPPPPDPPPPPPPPSPLLPPSPPEPLRQDVVMAELRLAEEEVCTTVYFLSQTTRCERLASALTKQYLMQFTNPPLPPPIVGTSPSPPPPSPPMPSLPAELNIVLPTFAMPSTMRYPSFPPAGTPVDPHGFYYASSELDLQSRLRTFQLGALACVPPFSDEQIACATGSLADQCINGVRRCGTDEENAQDPFIEFQFTITQDSYLWALRFTLPRNEQLATLFVGTKRVELFGARNTPIPCYEGDAEVATLPADYTVTMTCASPTASDDDLIALGTVWRARLTLTGSYRQVWLAKEKGIEIIERPLSAAEVTVLAHPPSPTQPPPPPGTGSVSCLFVALSFIDNESEIERLQHEPCGQTHDQCCASSHEHLATAYEIDDVGCCKLIFMKPLTMVSLASFTKYGSWSNRAGTGLVG